MEAVVLPFMLSQVLAGPPNTGGTRLEIDENAVITGSVCSRRGGSMNWYNEGFFTGCA